MIKAFKTILSITTALLVAFGLFAQNVPEVLAIASPAGADTNALNVSIGVTPSSINNGGTAYYSMTVSNVAPIPGLIPADATNIVIKLYKPSSNGSPTTDSPIIITVPSVPSGTSKVINSSTNPELAIPITVNSGVTIATARMEYTGTLLFHVPSAASGNLTVSLGIKPPKTPPCSSYGDLNSDGYVTDADIDLAENCILELSSCTSLHRTRADVNNDDIVNMGDVVLIQRYIDGIDSTFLVCNIAKGLSFSIDPGLPDCILNNGTDSLESWWTLTYDSTPSYYTFYVTDPNGSLVPGSTLTVNLTGQSSPIHNPEWTAHHLWNVPSGQATGTYSANFKYYANWGLSDSALIRFCIAAPTSTTPVCSNECSTAGAKQCSGSGYQTCGNYDSDSCLEWSNVTNCSAGYTCSAGNCTLNTTPLPNPELGQSCGLDIALVIDSSGTIDNSELNQIKSAFKGFVNTLLPTTPTQFSVTDFDKTARVLTGFTGSTSTIIGAINTPSSGGNTNWEDALIKAQSTLPNRSNPNLVIIASDGNPNTIGSGSSATEANALQKAIIAANNIKSSGTRIIALGIGNNLDLENLKKISSDDAVYTTSFNTLASDLANLASQLCGGTITVTNYVDGTATAGWEFQISTTTKTTGADGKTEAVPLANGTYDVTETFKAGYVLSSASCSGATNNGISASNGVFGIQIGTNNIVSCVFNNLTAPECKTNADCDNGLYCDGQETCQAGKCVVGIPIVCTANNVFPIATCSNTPDDNPFTWDNLNAFDSVCSEETDSCTLSMETMTHTCDVTQCGAQCDASHACADTVCHTQDGCVGNDYYTYSDIANTCSGDCSCTANICAEPTISYNDPACTECQTDADCVSLDNDYCDGSIAKHDAGICVNYSCQASTTVAQDCDNGLYCDGQETCSAGSCIAGTPINCSANNVLGIATCSNMPEDSNPFTWDARNPFDSVCSEETDSCSVATDTDLVITHTCSTDCGGCAVDADCNDDDIDTIDVCNLTSCQCENTPTDCPSIIVVSNTEDDVTGVEYSGKAVLTWVHGAWTSIPQANWIWKTYYVENSLVDEMYGFSKSFDIVGTVSSATLNLAADNTYRVWVNNVLVGENLGEHNYENSVSYDVADKLQNGTNTIKFEVMNMGLAESTVESNPAGLLYKLQIARSSCEPIGCTLGATSSCSTGLLGVCSGGISTCGDDGNFGTCVQSIASSTEVCSDGLDNDCDGLVDAEDSDCWECQPQATSTCATELFGVCGTGLQTCQDSGFWGTCIQSIASSTEVCDDDLDNDCNGVVDNGCAIEYYCGDGTCNNGESCGSCPSDCGSCGGGGGGGGGGTVILTNLSIFNEMVASVGIDNALITWQTNLFADSNVVYTPATSSTFDWNNSLNYGFANSTGKDSTQVTTHSMALNGLLPATTYYLKTVSFAGSEKAVSTELVFTTKAVEGTATETIPVFVPENIISSTTTGENPIIVENIIMPQEEATSPIAQIEPEMAAVASARFFDKNFCWITFVLLIILTILHFLRVLEKNRKSEKESFILPAIVVILIVLYFWKCCCFSCQVLGFTNCWKQWLLILINMAIFAVSMTVRKKESLPEQSPEPVQPIQPTQSSFPQNQI